MGRGPALDDLGAVDDDVVADDRDHGCGGVGGQQLLAKQVKLALTALRVT
jgi:hypothetical protein